MKRTGLFTLMATLIVGAIFAKGISLFANHDLLQSNSPILTQYADNSKIPSLGISPSSADASEWAVAYNSCIKDYPYVCGGLIKNDISKWQTSDFVVKNGEEHWNGRTGQNYYEQASSEWSASYWQHHASQIISLPKGKYLFSITARAASEVTSSMSIKVGDSDAITVILPNKGNVGKGISLNGEAAVEEDSVHTYANNNAGYGWEYRFIEFETTEDNQSVEISLDASSSTINQWVSLSQPCLYASTESEVTKPIDEIAEAIVTRSDVELKFTNDEIFPWYIDGNTVVSGNKGISNSTSSFSLTYSSSYSTQVSFNWWNNDRDYHTLYLFVDGVQVATNTSSSNTSKRFFVTEGTHVIEFRDIITEGYSNWNQTSCVKNISISQISPLESVVLSSKSQNLTFENDSVWPWLPDDGFIQSSNYNNKNTVSKFSTSFSIDKPSKFSFWSSTYYYDGNNNAQSYSGYQYFDFKINGERYMGREYGSGTTSILLEPGEYTMVWCDSIYEYSENLKSRVRDIELSSNWVEVDVASNAGTLGVEVLYLVNVLNDVEMLKVSGTINSTDWATIKQMKNILALDLSEAKFDAVPGYAFDGLSRLSSVKLPEGMKTIGEYAFRGTQIYAINIPSSVTSIGQYAFANTRIKTVNFEDNSSLQTIGNNAFRECSSLQEFIMPNSVTRLGTYNNYTDNECSTFYGCTNLRKIYFSDALTTLEQYVCYNCYNLTEVHLPVNLLSIRDNAFYNTSSLRKIDFPQTLQGIDYYAFYQCGVDSVKLPLTLSTLENYCFRNCDRLKYIELPSYIGSYDNNFYDCDGIEKIVCQSATPPSIKNDPFSNGRSKSAITLVVPSFAVVNYKLDNYWYQFGSIIEGDDIGYWKITGNLSLTNNRRMNGKPDIDLYDGGKLTVGGAAPMEVGQFNYYGYDSNPACLINDCPNMTADGVNTLYYFEKNKWYFFTPTHDVDLTKVYHTANASYVFRYYDGSSRATNGTGNSWRNVDDGKLIAGQGYILQCDANGYIVMPSEIENHSQILTSSDVTKSLSAYEATASANKSWNYVGNPYPSYYDIYYMDFTAPITVWTGSTYKAYSIVDDNLVLRPMQSFFVQKPDEVDNIIFHKEGRQLSSSIERASYAKPREGATSSAKRDFFNLQITSDDEVVDETRIVVNEKASLAYEIETDASKFMSMESNVPQLFTLDSENNRYAINERPLSDGSVRIGYRASVAGFYTISAIRADGNATLYDSKLNKTVDLTLQDYTFYSDATDEADNSRFILMLGVADPYTGIDNAETSRLSVNGSNGNIVVAGATGKHIIVYTIDGRQVYNGIANSANMNIAVPSGAYIIKVNNSTYKTSVF